MHHDRSDYDFDVISGPSGRLPAPTAAPLPSAPPAWPPQAAAPVAPVAPASTGGAKNDGKA